MRVGKNVQRPGAVYEVEDLWASGLPDRHQQDLTPKQVERLVAKHVGSLVEVKFTGKRGGAHFRNHWYPDRGEDRPVLSFTYNSVHQRTPRWLILHEIAHALTPGRLHDVAWLTVYGALVEKEIGKGQARKLRIRLGKELGIPHDHWSAA